MFCPKIFRATVMLTRISTNTTPEKAPTARLSESDSRNKRGQFVWSTCGKCFGKRSTLERHELVHSDCKPFGCPHGNCALRFRLQDNMKKHVTRMHEKLKPHRCSVRGCGKAFVTGLELQRHASVHTDAKPVACPEHGCERRFGNDHSLWAHKARWHSANRERKYGCETCGKMFFARAGLQQHELTHSAEKPCVCPICPGTFAATSSLSAHIRRMHTGEKSFECAVCQKRFVTAVELRSHTRVHSSAEERSSILIPCDVCSKKFTAKSSKRLHMQNFHVFGPGVNASTPRVFDCSESECGKSFKTTGQLKGHELRHRRAQASSLFTCTECDKTFANRQNLATHGSVHTGLRPHSCTYCSKTFRLKSTMLEHIVRKHTKERPHRCTLCRADFATPFQLQNHTTSAHHPTNTRRLRKCEECGKELSSLKNLALHRARKHDKDVAAKKKHSCSEPGCSWRFLTAAELQIHARRHSGQKPFPCPFCPSAFATCGPRTLHVRRLHARELPHECAVVGCGKRFVILSELKRHSTVHERLEKRERFTCSICGQNFLTGAGRRFHVRNINLNERPHACGECEYASATASNVKRHKAQVHGK